MNPTRFRLMAGLKCRSVLGDLLRRRQPEGSRASVTEAFHKALAAERLRNGRWISALRLVGTSLFLALVLYDAARNRSWRQITYPEVLAGYWFFSLLSFAGCSVSDRIIRISSLLIPLVDVPWVFLIQLGVMHGSADPRAVANFALGLYIVVVMFGAATLRGWEVLLTSVTAILAEQALQHLAGEPLFGRLGSVLLIGLAAGLCEAARERRVQMVDQVCSEQLLRERLGRYFSPKVAELIQHQPQGLAESQDCHISVLFADLCGFTQLAEELGSARTVALLNEFHASMVEAIFSNGGTLDKYLGDGLMAYFGAPLAQPDHAGRAVECALKMQDALADFNRRRSQRGEQPLRMRVAVHSGPAVIGSIGAPHRREFTVVGDTVNIASRLEQAAKLLQEEVLMSETVRQALGDRFLCKPLDTIIVKGKGAPLSIYAPRRATAPTEFTATADTSNASSGRQ